MKNLKKTHILGIVAAILLIIIAAPFYLNQFAAVDPAFIEELESSPVIADQINDNICWGSFELDPTFENQLAKSSNQELQEGADLFEKKAAELHQKEYFYEADTYYRGRLEIYKKLFGEGSEKTIKACQQLMTNVKALVTQTNAEGRPKLQ